MPLTPDKVSTWNGLKVNEFLLTKNNPYNIALPGYALPTVPLGITVHNTGAISVASNTTMAEQYTRATMYGNMNDVRVHFYVDDVCAWQNLPLTINGWHAADGDGPGNRKTISIEVIGNSAKAEANAVKLVAYLLNKYNLNVDDNVFTHTHWLNVRDGKKGTNDYLNTTPHPYKTCPIYIIPHWESFKNQIKSSLNALKGGAASTSTTTSQTTTSNLYRIRKTWEDAKSQIGAYASLESAKKACTAGYKVFDSNGKVVYPISSNTTSTAPERKIDVTYQVRANSWRSVITNCNDTNDMGYAGIENLPINCLAAKSSEGKLFYRVHLLNGGWLSWISNFNLSDLYKGYAGIPTGKIDAIQAYLTGVEGYEVQYRVSSNSTTGYYGWITGSSNYAGIFGKPIDKIQMKIIKK